MPPFLYIFLGALAIVSALGVVMQRNPIHSLLALISTLLIDRHAVSLARTPSSVGFLQIIVYVGAIMVLFLFVIWLLNLQAETGTDGHLALKLFGSLAAAALATELFSLLAPPHLQVEVHSRARRLWFDREPRAEAVYRLPDRVRGDFGAAAGRGGGSGRARAPAAGSPSRSHSRASRQKIAS